MHGSLKYFGNDGQYDIYSDSQNYTFQGIQHGGCLS